MGFTNSCAVRNSVIFERALRWWSTGTWSGRAYRRQRSREGRHWPRATHRCCFGLFFSIPFPFSTSSSLSQHENEIKNKLSTVSSCSGPLSVGWSKEIIRKLVKIVHIAEDDHENVAEARVAWRASRLSASLWGDGRRRKTIEAFSTFPEGCVGRTGESTVVTTPKGRMSSQKVDTSPQGQTFAGLLCNQALAKTKLTK